MPGLDPNVGRIYQAPSFIPSTRAAAAAAAAAAARAGGFDAFPITRLCTPAAGALCDPAAAPASTPYTTVLAIDVNATVALAPAQLLPDLSAAGDVARYVAAPWARGFAASAAACAQGAPAAGCVAPFSAAEPLPIFTGAPQLNYTHDFELYSLAPLYANGWALVGELGKVVRVSPARFAFAAPAGAGFEFGVLGAAGEAVAVAVLAPAGARAPPPAGSVAGVMLAVALRIPAAGAATVTCSGAGAGAACTQS